jgi:hypothetical protein
LIVLVSESISILERYENKQAYNTTNSYSDLNAKF